MDVISGLLEVVVVVVVIVVVLLFLDSLMLLWVCIESVFIFLLGVGAVGWVVTPNAWLMSWFFGSKRRRRLGVEF